MTARELFVTEESWINNNKSKQLIGSTTTAALIDGFEKKWNEKKNKSHLQRKLADLICLNADWSEIESIGGINLLQWTVPMLITLEWKLVILVPEKIQQENN